jgi:hypothetical protein
MHAFYSVFPSNFNSKTVMHWIIRLVKRYITNAAALIRKNG